jgi:hypothetical protein
MRMVSKAVVVAVVGMGVALVPSGALARGGGGGGGFARGAIHVGPVFGFPRAHVAAHRAFRHGFVRRFPARFGRNLNRWNVDRFALRNHGAAWGAAYPFTGDAGGTYYDPSDVTGAVGAPARAAVLPPPAYPPERPGCYSQNYNVPSASGGTARVVVTRC